MHAWPHEKFRARFYRNALPFESKNNPQPAVSGLTTYTWDAQDRLASVTLPNGSVHRYEYDYRTRRVGTSETPSAPGSATKSTAIVFSGGLSVAEWESSSSFSSISGAATVDYTRGPDMGGGVGGLLHTSRRDTNSPGLPVSSSPSLRYNLSNGRGDIVAQSDAYAALTWTASYEAYGKRTKETGENKDKQRGNSKDEDPTGLLNEGFRYRDIETGVWLSRDPAGFVDGPNVYAYVKQNPWSAFDPDGLKTKETAAQQAAKQTAEALKAIKKVTGKTFTPKDFASNSAQRTAAIAAALATLAYIQSHPDEFGGDKVAEPGTLLKPTTILRGLPRPQPQTDREEKTKNPPDDKTVELVYRGMNQKDGQWIQSPLEGAPNGKQMGARTKASNPKFFDFPVTNPSEIVGLGPEGLSANRNPLAAMSNGATHLGAVSTGTLRAMGLNPVNDHDSHISIRPAIPMPFLSAQTLYNHIPWVSISPPKPISEPGK